MNLKKFCTINWLEQKLLNRESGIIVDAVCQDRFDNILDFLQVYSYSFQTPVIYYQAFPKENSQDFLNTLTEELVGKLKPSNIDSQDSFKEIVEKTRLKMVIIDKCHLHSAETLAQIRQHLDDHNVSLVLGSSYQEMNDAQILGHPAFKLWDSIDFYQEEELYTLVPA